MLAVGSERQIERLADVDRRALPKQVSDGEIGLRDAVLLVGRVAQQHEGLAFVLFDPEALPEQVGQRGLRHLLTGVGAALIGLRRLGIVRLDTLPEFAQLAEPVPAGRIAEVDRALECLGCLPVIDIRALSVLVEIAGHVGAMAKAVLGRGLVKPQRLAEVLRHAGPRGGAVGDIRFGRRETCRGRLLQQIEGAVIVGLNAVRDGAPQHQAQQISRKTVAGSARRVEQRHRRGRMAGEDPDPREPGLGLCRIRDRLYGRLAGRLGAVEEDLCIGKAATTPARLVGRGRKRPADRDGIAVRRRIPAHADHLGISQGGPRGQQQDAQADCGEAVSEHVPSLQRPLILDQGAGAGEPVFTESPGRPAAGRALRGRRGRRHSAPRRAPRWRRSAARAW